jgi:hypothetical protein
MSVSTRSSVRDSTASQAHLPQPLRDPMGLRPWKDSNRPSSVVVRLIRRPLHSNTPSAGTDAHSFVGKDLVDRFNCIVEGMDIVIVQHDSPELAPVLLI